MVLLFLRDWRSVIVVVLNIPFALLGVGRRPVADRADDQPDDARRAGAGRRHPRRRGDRRGREHPHADASTRRSIARAVRLGNPETAVPRLLAMLCILAVFIPSFFMQGAARGAVRAAVAGGRLRDDHVATSCPARSCRCCRSGCCAARPTHEHRGRNTGLWRADCQGRYARVWTTSSARWLGCVPRPTYVVAAVAVIWFGGPASSARRSSRSVDAGQFQLRAPGARRHAHRAHRGARHRRRSTSSSEDGRAGQRRHLASATSASIPSELSDQHRLPVDGRARRRRCCADRRSKARGAACASDCRVEELRGRRCARRPGRGAGRRPVALAVLVRAGRHRQRGHELRLADADRGRRQRPESGRRAGPTPRRSASRAGADRRRCATCSSSSRSTIPTVEVHGRPREGRAERRDRRRTWPARWWRPRRRAGSSCRTTGAIRRRASATRCRSRCP